MKPLIKEVHWCCICSVISLGPEVYRMGYWNIFAYINARLKPELLNPLFKHSQEAILPNPCIPYMQADLTPKQRWHMVFFTVPHKNVQQKMPESLYC